MHLDSIGGRGKYIPCKHLCHFFLVVLRAYPYNDIFIHSSTWNVEKLAKLLARDPMMQNLCVVGKFVIYV